MYFKMSTLNMPGYWKYASYPPSSRIKQTQDPETRSLRRHSATSITCFRYLHCPSVHQYDSACVLIKHVFSSLGRNLQFCLNTVKPGPKSETIPDSERGRYSHIMLLRKLYLLSLYEPSNA